MFVGDLKLMGAPLPEIARAQLQVSSKTRVHRVWLCSGEGLTQGNAGVSNEKFDKTLSFPWNLSLVDAK